MKKILLLMLLSLIFTVNVSNLNAQNDNLEPVKGIFERTNIGYYIDSLIRKNLFNGLSDWPEIRLLIIPAFGGEKVVNIEFDRDNNKYFMKYIIHEEIGWYTKSKRKLHKYNKEISKESVQQIKKLYTTAINKVRWHTDSMSVRDGADYYYTVTDFRMRSGMICSPHEGTKMGRLVDIGYELIELAKNKVRMVEFDSIFSAKIQKLTEDIENQK